jgi:hypothetical protein
MKSSVRLLLPVYALLWVPAHAGIISYSDSGTFSALTPSSAFAGPSEAWTFNFQADSNPAVSDVGNGGFDFAFSSFSYSLNSLPVAIQPTFLRFFSGTNGGGFDICFSGTTAASCTDVAAGSIHLGCVRRQCELDCLQPAEYYRAGHRPGTLDFTDSRRRAFGIGRATSLLAQLAAFRFEQ